MEIPFGYIENGVLYRSAFAEYETLKLKEIKEDDDIDKLVASCVTVYDKLRDKLSVIDEKVNTSGNKGSFLSSIQNIKSQISSHGGLGDYQSLISKIEALENMLSDYVSKNRLKNTEIKKALLEELNLILENNDQYEALEQIKSLKIRWVKTGSVVDEVKGTIEGDYQKGVDLFYEKLKEFESDKKELFEDRVKEYQVVVSKIESIIKKGDFSNKSFDTVKELQKEWKEVGRVNEESFKEVNAKYWKVCQTYFEQQKEFKKQARKNKSVKEKEGVTKRKEILDKLRLFCDKSLKSSLVKDLTQIKTDWRNAGSVSSKMYSELQDEFGKTLRAIEERQFILKLAKAKHKGFEQSKAEDKIRSLTKMTYHLLSRDENELSSFQDNMDKMHISEGSFYEMLESKLAAQKSKVEIKKDILKELKVKSVKE